ncbi:MAG: hypothetical protein JKY70_17660 [Mucilaginibacter sp.]|nr:hypothetical protein [Mucilaginibacter sp.]
MGNFQNISIEAYHDGALENFEILKSDGQYNISQGGRIIAAIEEADGWKQVSGAALGSDVLEKIIYTIEKHYRYKTRFS